MGDPRRLKNKYSTPIHPWEKLRLEAEKPLMKEYGLVNKKELWKISSKLKNFKDTAKMLVASRSAQAEIEKKQMTERMKSYGLISTDELDEILGLEVQALLDRRLQTVVFKKGLARTIKQARQMITHRHIAVNGVKITAPGYLVKLSEQDSVSFMVNSNFDTADHPERVSLVVEEVKAEVKVASDKDKNKDNVDSKVVEESKSDAEKKEVEVKEEPKPVVDVKSKESDKKDEVAKSDKKDEVAKSDKKDEVAKSDKKDEVAKSDKKDVVAESDKKDEVAESDKKDEVAKSDKKADDESVKNEA